MNRDERFEMEREAERLAGMSLELDGVSDQCLENMVSDYRRAEQARKVAARAQRSSKQ
jgi:hypothetical protein